MAVTVTHSTPADGSFSTQGAAAWNATHTLSGVGTMAEQNANAVNITGGSITGVTGLGTVTSVSGTGTVNGLTLTGTVTTSGSLTLGGTLTGIANSALTNSTITINGTSTALGGSISVGTVTSVAALTLGTTGTDLSSTVATGTTTPVITLNVPTASATNRGALSSTDWSTFNNKQAALVSGSNIKTVNGTSLLGSGDVGTISVAYGGTGATSLTGVVIGNGTSAFTTVTAPSGAIVGTTDTQNLTNKTMTTGNTLDAGTSVSDTGTIAANSPGFRGLPQNSQTASYTLALADAGKHISITTGGVVIPANGSVAFPVGTAISIYNNSGSNQTISITTDTLRQAGTANTGSRTLAQYGLATCVKVSSTTWVISGAGIS